MDEELAKELTVEQRALLKEIRVREEERRKQWMNERAKRNEQRNEPRPPGPPPSP
jgi:hypothetical protein